MKREPAQIVENTARGGPDPLRRWGNIALAAAIAIVLALPAYVVKETITRGRREPPAPAGATFVGRAVCIECHREAYEKWRGSDHDRAMDAAADSTVLGDFEDAVFEGGGLTARFYRKDGRFFVRTQGPGGEPGDFEIAYTFGFEPLQQYLVPFPGGRLQALSIAWDTARGKWFFLYPDRDIPPDDWLHWTRNAQNWNGMCAECHSTNLVKHYDAETKTFRTTWSEIDVSCEACHGPASRHVEWAKLPPMARPATENYGLVMRTGGIGAGEFVELCAPCHSRRTQAGDYDHTKPRLMDDFVPALLEETLYYPDGQILDEVYVYGSFLQSKMFRNDVRCNDCHDVHALKLVEEGNALCLRCHQAEVYDGYDHHFHKQQHEGKPSDGRLCVKCHMPERPYMVVDWRADHSLRAPRPDLTVKIGTPNACAQSGCHDDKPDAWAAEHHAKWYGLARKPHYGTVIAAARDGRPEIRDELIRLTGDALAPAIVRASALSLLERYPGEESASAFNRALQDGDPLIRHTAVDRAGAANEREFKELLTPLLFDSVRVVRMEAAARLAGLPERLFKPYQREALSEALAEYKRAMEYSLDFAYAGHNLGVLYARMNAPALAERYYKAAIEIDDLFYPAVANLAVLYNAQGRNEEAEALLRRVLDAHPDQYDAAHSLGLVLAEMKRYDEAAVFLDRAAKGVPDRARVFYNLGLTLEAAGRRVEAEGALIRAVELEPADFDFLYVLADHYAKRGEHEKALAAAERMTAAHPGNVAGRDLKERIEKAALSAGAR